MKRRILIPALILINILVISLFIILYTNSTYPTVGNDYRLFGPRLLDTFLYYKVNGFGIEWYTPSFGGGLPAYPNPLQMQFSFQQFFTLFTNPWVAIMLACVQLAGLKHIITSHAFVERARLDLEPLRQAGLQFIYLEEVRQRIGWWRKLAAPGNWCVWLRLWYSRRCELTCDRMALYCTDNLHTSQLALMNATVGAQLADQVNVKEAVQQWEQHRSEFFVQYRTLYSTHPHNLARLQHLQSAALELGIPG